MYLSLALFAGLALSPNPPSLIDDLLRLPIQLPEEGFQPKRAVPQPQRDPGEDAPIDALWSYWRSAAADRQPLIPSKRVVDRLLVMCEESPAELLSLLPVFRESPTAHDRIKAIFDKNASALGFDKVRQFLRRHSRYFREELIAMARGARDEKYWVHNSEELEALARLDGDASEPILLEHVRSNQPRTRAFALAQLYLRAVQQASRERADAYRSQLQAIVEDRRYPGRGRDYAADALLSTEWEGKMPWHLARFADPTLRDLRDDSLLMSPLCTVAGEPARGITLFTGLVGHRDRTVHVAAVTCLVAFYGHNARRDALLPLLPWLHDPQWASARDRLRLIQSMDRLDLRESIPGLIAVLGQADETNRAYAAESLAHFRDPHAVPALRAALHQEKRFDYRRRIIHGLIACGGVGDAEAAAALEAVARLSSTEAGRKQLEAASFSRDVLGVDVSIGLYLSYREAPPDGVIQRLLVRAGELRKPQPGVATAIGTLLARWDSPVLARDFVRRLKDGNVTAESIAFAMSRREKLVAAVGAELRLVKAMRGVPAGVAAALLGDGGSVLSSNDEAALAALLSSARLRQLTLPMDAVERTVLQAKGNVRRAGLAYLEAIDSAETRRILYALHAGDAHISGNRSPHDPGHTTFREFDAREASLRKQVRAAGGPDRIWALLTAGYWGGAGQLMVHLRGEKGQVIFEPDEARYLLRELKPEELEHLRQFLAKNQVEKLGPLETGAHDGMQMEFVDLSRAGGYRVFMNNPQTRAGSVHRQLCDLFRDLLNDPSFQMRYRVADSLRDFHVLLPGPGSSQIQALWKPGAHLLAFTQADVQRQRVSGVVVPGEGLMSAKIIVSPKGPDAVSEWKRWTGSALAEDATAPAALHWPAGFQPDEGRNERLWSLASRAGRFVVGVWQSRQGLWRVAEGRDPELVLAGDLLGPVLAANGEWIVVAQAEGNWAQPNWLVRVHLPTKRVYRVSIPVADTLNAIAELPTGGVLVVRVRDSEAPGITPVAGPAEPEYLVVDPATGKWRKVDGEFWPFEQDTLRPPQPGPLPNSIWVARRDFEAHGTTIGLFDTVRWRFTPVVALPSTLLAASAFWVDNDQVIAAYGGDLLGFRLPSLR